MIFNNALCHRTAVSDICRLQITDCNRGTKTVDYTEEKMAEDRWLHETGQTLIRQN